MLTPTDFGVSALYALTGIYADHLSDQMHFARTEIETMLQGETISTDDVMKATHLLSDLKAEYSAVCAIRENRLYLHKHDWALGTFMLGMVTGEQLVAQHYLDGASQLPVKAPPAAPVSEFDTVAREILASIKLEKPANPDRIENLVRELEQLYTEEVGDFVFSDESVAALRHMVLERNLNLVKAALQ